MFVREEQHGTTFEFAPLPAEMSSDPTGSGSGLSHDGRTRPCLDAGLLVCTNVDVPLWERNHYSLFLEFVLNRPVQMVDC
jgi:hypothetical protein